MSVDILLCNQYLYCDYLVEEIIIREEQNEDERQAQGKISSSDKCHKVID